MSRMGGHFAFLKFGIYHATKWGIESYFEALAREVQPFGIKTMLVEPADTPPPPVEDMPASQSGVAHRRSRPRSPPLRLLLNSTPTPTRT